MLKQLTTSLIVLLLGACTSLATVSELPVSANAVDFNALAKQDLNPKNATWNFKSDFKYIVRTSTVSEQELVAAIKLALTDTGYTVKTVDIAQQAIIAERGLRPNEWSAVAGVYFKTEKDFSWVYVNSRITESLTGGWDEHRAKEVTDQLCEKLSCIK